MAENKACLIIDDSEVIREISSRIVESLGFKAFQASDASQGVEVCKDNKVTVVLLDWDLPSMGALDFLRSVTEALGDTKPVIVLCATENDQQQFTLAKAAGVSDHILKPFDKNSIESKFRELGVLDGNVEEFSGNDESDAAASQ